MKLIHKLIALLLLCGVLPLLAVSALLISIGRHQVEMTVEQVHRLEAGATASHVADTMQRARNRLTMDLEGSVAIMSDEAIQKTLVWTMSKADNLIHFRILRVYDDRGAPITQPVRLPAESIPMDHRAAFLVVDEDIVEFQRRTPLAEALKSREVQVSEVYVNKRRNEALVAMAVPILDRLDQIQAIVVGEVSLREIQRLVSDVTIGSAGHAYLVDASGRAIAHPEFDRVRDGESLADLPIVAAALLSSTQAETLSFADAHGVEQLGAHAPAWWGGWQLVVQQPAEDAFHAVREMIVRATYILLVALAASLALGWLYVRNLVGPLRKVMDGMRRIVDGQFEHRLDTTGTDEVGELAGAFNVMGRMLLSYKKEVEGWNRELQTRVDSKTRALENAQAQLVQSAKLSSLGQLGAGVAHELNNPLAGVVGQATLLKRRLRKIELPAEERERLEGYVAHIERESGRCREIVHGLLSFSQTTQGGTDSVDVNETIGKLLILVQSNLRAAGIVMKTELDAALPRIDANEPQLQQVLMHVLTNAHQAMPGGGSVVVRTRRDAGGRIAIEVQDTGRGIAQEHLDKIFDPFFTTKDVWQSPGLGLSVCYSIVESHGGHIEVESTVGEGTTMRVLLPVEAPAKADARREAAAEPVGLRRGRAPAAVGG